MTAFDVGLLVWVVTLFVAVPLITLAVTAPGVVPWGMRGRAARMVEAMECWLSGRHDVARGRGYFAMRDYTGVESAYLAARRIVDGEVQP
jgi:hypothetical protein